MKNKNIFKIESPYLIFRDKAIDLIKKIKTAKRDKTISLDFSQVKFLSGSFADELLLLIEKYKNLNLTIRFVNLNPKIKKFLKLIQKRKEKIKKEIGK